MNTLEKYLRMPLSLYEIGDVLTTLPSPRKQLFNLLVAVTGLAPNTVKMILCSTKAGFIPPRETCRKIAKALCKSEEALFPEDRTQKGSLVDLYTSLSAKKVELHQFVNMISISTRASPKTVRKWLKQRRVPGRTARKDIARAIGVSIVKLFPQEDGE